MQSPALRRDRGADQRQRSRVGAGVDDRREFASSTADALPWLAVLAGWLAIAAAVTKRYFRWEPRQA
jgi:hypothetical protein